MDEDSSSYGLEKHVVEGDKMDRNEWFLTAEEVKMVSDYSDPSNLELVEVATGHGPLKETVVVKGNESILVP